MQGQAYRPDIDGLRAIAVLVVVFFHVGFAPFSGGYVGVDVFFVISGFLITRLIREQIGKGTFSFATFYARRARRLFPALFFTLVVSFVFATMLFSPDDLERFAQSVIFTVLSVSNFLFWRESGYFDAEANVKPLLHTWSLSVEEQFYLVWPLTMVVLAWLGSRLAARGYRHAPDRTIPVFLAVAGLIALAATELLLPVDAAAAFYLAPFRITEFAIGGVMVWLVAYRPKNPLLLEPLVVVGLALIAWPVFAYSEETVFPGLNALPPCLGTALLIYAGTARHLGRLLNNRAAVGIGLISYSLYLVHWPMIVFYTYWVARPLEPVEQWAIVIGSTGLAAAMYFLVETPFRRGASKPRAWSPARFGMACAALAALLIVPAANAWSTSGWPSRLPQEVRDAVAGLKEKRNLTWEPVNPLREKVSFADGKVRVLVVGDSHGKDATNALLFADEALGNKLDIINVGIFYQCQPYLGPRTATNELPQRRIDICNERMRDLIEGDLSKSADYIVFSARWLESGVENIGETIRAIQRNTDAQIVIFGRTAEFEDVPALLTRFGRMQDFDRYLASKRIDNSHINEPLKRIAEENGARYLSKEDIICPKRDYCYSFNDGEDILFYDYGHWTLEGARFFANKMIEAGTLDFLAK